MPWNLEIHHLDVGSTGDATLIIARHPGTPPILRTVLIDAGKAHHAYRVHTYIQGLGITQIDVIVATHYDNDHYSGLHTLLSRPSPNIYDHAIVYDQGQPPYHKAYYRRSKSVPKKKRKSASQNKRAYSGPGVIYKEQTDYLKYIKALRDKPNVRRATIFVNSFQVVQYDGNDQHAYPPPPLAPPAPPPAPEPLTVGHHWADEVDWDSDENDWVEDNYYSGTTTPPTASANTPNINDQRPLQGQNALPPFWLLGKEIMWGNGMDGKNGRGAFAPAIVPPANRPTLTCIAANKWTHQGGANRSFVSDINIYDGPDRMDNDVINEVENGVPPSGRGNPDDNSKSLGFLLQFNNFKYYIAGDLPEAQEDGAYNTNLKPFIFKNGVRHFLNPNSNFPERVLLIKTSHHGSDTSSSRQFVTQLRPSAAVISCGPENEYGHPAQRTVNVLDGYPHIPINGEDSPGNEHPDRPPAPLNQPVRHYLTGYQNPDEEEFSERSRGGDASYTAGDPEDPETNPGHVVVRASEEESLRPVVGQLYRGIRAAASTINTHLAVGLNNAELDAIAENGAAFGTYAAVALAVGANVEVGTEALKTASWVGQDDFEDSLIEVAVLGSEGSKKAARIAASIAKIKDDETFNDDDFPNIHGLAAAIANAVNGQNAAAITAAARGADPPASNNASSAAGHAGAQNFQQFTAPHGAIPAGYAVAAAMAAANITAPDTPSVGQAVAIATAIALEVYLSLTDPKPPRIGRQAQIDLIYNAARAGGLSSERAALGAAVAVATLKKGGANRVKYAVKYALQKQGVGKDTAKAQGELAKAAAEANAGSLFTVEYYNANRKHKPRKAIRRITHTY